jgi:site-specific DNA recombinase
MTKPVLRCAIYTRKSSDEGLEQAFNSLDAQREAAEAYVRSQTSEGWKVIDTRYDDGGFSGGTMERPGLQPLLRDIGHGMIDIVVVYKIDRLTRSLLDFSRIVETFEKAGTSFVSVTQSFNTTNSMGRLMLNVLLSFAQFEREVTGERIRDKIAQSKAKGMWMGGALPLGYDLPLPGSRTLNVNAEEAIQVRHIFRRYLDLGSVHELQRELAAEGYRSKARVTASGKSMGGAPFSRGALFHLLRNPLYRGRIVHKDRVHPGEHEPIVDEALFAEVQERLDANARRHRAASHTRVARAPLTGRLFDAAGEPMNPTFSHGCTGKAYRYYVSASLQQGVPVPKDGQVRRLPATEIERVIHASVRRWSGSDDHELEVVHAVRLSDAGLTIELDAKRITDLALRLEEGEQILHRSGGRASVHLPIALPLRGGRHTSAGGRRTLRRDPTLIAALRKAHRMVMRKDGMPEIGSAPASPYERSILRLAFIAPDIQRDILEGRTPQGFNLEKLQSIPLPLSWSEQRSALGWLHNA